MDKYKVLKEYFGHSSFREGQETIIDEILSGHDVLGIMPTGAGKSLCYQIPAILSDGITIVVSPLISLMKDQVNALVQSGIRAAYINSSLTFNQYLKVCDNARMGTYKIIYVAPERLLLEAFVNLCRNIKISLVAIDEAHCVSQWGQDFRPSYLKITEFIKLLPQRPPVCAFTATATGEVGDDIVRILNLDNPFRITTGFDRKNLYFEVINNPKNRFQTLYELIKQREGKVGIVYCLTRKTVEEVCEKLNNHGIKASRYHAGLESEERHLNQEDFIYDRADVMVATNAFGMGIDKSNVSYVIHYNIPKSLEAYYQEAGRAGRDGSEADCILIYSGMDVRTNKWMIENSEDNPELSEQMKIKVKEKELERLRQMTFYSTTTKCLRSYILNYFGEKSQPFCGKCSVCETGTEIKDITEEAYAILECVQHFSTIFGKKRIIDILRGKSSETRNADRFDGILEDKSEPLLRSVFDFLISKGCIGTSDGQYPTVFITPKGAELLERKVKITMRTLKEKKPPVRIAAEKAVSDILFERLRALRAHIALEKGIPAFLVFSDITLRDMCRKQPLTTEEMLEVNGVGRAKMQKFGKPFLEEIQKYQGY